MSDETPTPAPEPEAQPEGMWTVPEHVEAELTAATETPAVAPEATTETPEAPLPDLWGNPLDMVRELATAPPMPMPAPQPMPAPTPPPSGMPAFDFERAQTDFEGATRDWTTKMAEAMEAKVRGEFQQRDARADAVEKANLVVGSLSAGEKIVGEIVKTDPALRDPRVEQAFSLAIREAQFRAISNPASSSALRSRGFFRAIIEDIKERVGYQGPPVAANMSGARTLSGQTAGRAPVTATSLTDYEKRYCEENHIPLKTYMENKAASEREARGF